MRPLAAEVQRGNGIAYVPCAVAVILSVRSSHHTWAVATTLRRLTASSLARQNKRLPCAGRRNRIDSSDVIAIGSIRPSAAKVTYQSAASTIANCVGPETNPPGRTSR